ncbi:MAG: sigma 54-interacting transcriptional regulator, partial [Bacteroidota bacterium]
MRAFDLEKNRTLAAICDAAEASHNGVLWLQADGQILAANQGLLEQLGYQEDTDLPKTIFEVNPTMSFLSWKKFWKNVASQKTLALESEFLTADESIYPVKLNCVLLDIDGEKVMMMAAQNMMETKRYEDLFNLAARIANIGSWELDLVNDDVLFNDQMYTLLELPPDTKLTETSLTKHLTSGMSAEDLASYDEKMKAAMEHGTPFSLDYSFELHGEFKNFNLHAHPVVLEEQTIKIYGTLQNVANISKRTDDMYFTKFCMDHARDMIYWVTPDGLITYVNQTVCATMGYAAEEMIGRSIRFLDEDFPESDEEFWVALRKEKSIEFETFNITKGGKKIPVSVVTNYINYRGREFNCAFVRDLSRKKERDKILQMSKHTLDHSLDMIFWLNEDGTFKYFNHAFLQKTGYTSEEVSQMKILHFFPNSNSENFSKGWEKLKMGTKSLGMDRDLKLKNGDIVPCEMNVSMVQFDNEEFSVTVLRDVSERRSKESQIQIHISEIEKLQAATKAENIALKEEFDLEFNFSNIISRDPNYKRVLRQVEQVADTDATVLILGETGTGKELLARAIHQLSARAEIPMVKVNCGALPENLIESELFGHEKGAFTGAYQRKIGKFERADDGTIFLDEIGELPLDLQAKLLRVLQEGEIERVGGTELININVRIITATNRDLEEEVRKGTFREDLFYRLNVFPIYNIPLRERR